MIDWVYFQDEFKPNSDSGPCAYCRNKSAERAPPGEPVIIRNNKGELCESCRVELVKENEDAAKIYFKVRDQTLRAGPDGIVVGINHLAVWAMIDAYEIKDRIGTFEKVIQCWCEIRSRQED